MTDKENKPKGNKGSAKDAKKEKQEELSEEDLLEKEALDKAAADLIEGKRDAALAALSLMTEKLQNATSSMTSVPRPLKFLRPHLDPLQEAYKMADSQVKQPFADVLSFLCTGSTHVPVPDLPKKEKDGEEKDAEQLKKEEEEKQRQKEEEEKPRPRLSLQYRLEGSSGDITVWGNEYLMNLSGEIAAEYRERIGKAENAPIHDLLALTSQIVTHNLKHHDEVAAVDLLCEMDRIQDLVNSVTEHTWRRCVPYLVGVSSFGGTIEDRCRMLRVCCTICRNFKACPDALRIAIKLGDKGLMQDIFEECEDPVVRKQMAFMTWRAGVDLPFDELFGDDLQQVASGEMLSTHFLALAKELDLNEPRLPEDIYKSHLDSKAAHLDSARENLAATFVNAFVNAGFCKDKMMTVEGSGWLYKNKEHGMMSAAASLGMLLMWDVEGNLSEIDKYQWSSEEYVKAGAMLAFGLLTSSIKSDCDPVWALLSEQLEVESALIKTAAVVGLGFAYAGKGREDLLEHITPMIVDTICSVECSAMAAVALGLVFVGSCSEDVAQAILQTLLERQAVDGGLDSPLAPFFGVGLGLVFLGQGDSADATAAALDAVTHPMGKYAKLTVETCAYAGSGDVLKVQSLLQVCGEHIEDEKEAMHQAVAVLGLGLVPLGEEVGTAMAMRALDHILQYGELPLRRAYPLVAALLHVSNPKVQLVEMLSKLTHDSDADLALNAIFAMGIVGAGTNNARIAGLLRQLASFYAKDANALFMTRIAQGFLFMGKGLISLSPLHSDRFLLNPVVLGSLLVVLHAQLFSRETILGKAHYLLFHLAACMQPRMLVTLDEELNALPVAVRVGQAVDTIGQAGKPKRVTGFQTHTTPVLLGYNDRAELNDEEYLALTPVLEGFVILRKNPNFEPEKKDGPKMSPKMSPTMSPR